jgi:DNA-directed RNA polymerase subunit RPC12/RpoP
MAKVPITMMGYRCERCGHEWVPRDFDNEPRVCPKCKSAYWDKPRKSMMPYEDFSAKIVATLKSAGHSLTWTEIRTTAGLPQAFPNNQWVHRMEKEVGLRRQRDQHGVIHWQLSDVADSTTPKAAEPVRARSGRK